MSAGKSQLRREDNLAVDWSLTPCLNRCTVFSLWPVEAYPRTTKPVVPTKGGLMVR